MINKDVTVRDTIRMLLADIKRYEIDERAKADDAVISNLINRNVKQRRDSIQQFQKGGREDLVAREQEELEVILKYLPEQLSDDEIKDLVQKAITELSVESMKDMGKLMGYLKPQKNLHQALNLYQQLQKLEKFLLLFYQDAKDLI